MSLHLCTPSAPSHEDPMHPITDEQRSARPDRRSMMRGLLGAAVGAAAVGTAFRSDTAAASTGNLVYGASNNAGLDTTTLTADVSFGRTLSIANPANGGFAVAGEADFVYGGFARAAAIYMTSAGSGAIISSQDDCFVGVSNRGTALRGTSTSGLGLLATGGRADALFLGTGDSPNSRIDPHTAGEILKDRDNNLWACVVAGSPGTWRKIAGPAAAGSLHVIEPTRVYDSRWPTGGGRLQNGDARGVDISAGRNLLTGVIETADLVPARATAVQYTVTVTDTEGAGFVAVTSINATAYRASTINWSTPGSNLANSTLGRLTSPELRLWCGGGGSTHIIIDILGYHL
jgi:hypothetical protein